jgi:hypothetical protein
MVWDFFTMPGLSELPSEINALSCGNQGCREARSIASIVFTRVWDFFTTLGLSELTSEI